MSSYFQDDNYDKEKKESILPKGMDSPNKSRKSSRIFKKPIDLSVYQIIIDIIGTNNYTYKIYLITALFFLSDGGEMIVLSLMLTKVADSWGLSPALKGMLGSSVFIGIFIGALICGRFSDIKGRRPVFIIGSLLVTIFSLLSAFCNDYFTFFICRGLCGVGVGLSLPSSSALALEVTPTCLRHLVIVVLMFSFPFGEIFVIIIAKVILPMEWGWRYLLAFATIPCLIGFIMSLIIYESPKFLLTARRFDEGFESLEKLIAASGKDFVLTDQIKQNLKEEFIIYTKLLEDDSEEVEEEKSEGLWETLKNAFKLTRHVQPAEEYSEENLRKKLDEFLERDRKERQIKKENSFKKRFSNDIFDMELAKTNSSNLNDKKKFEGKSYSDFNMFQNVYSTGNEIEEKELIKKKFSDDRNRDSIDSLTGENSTPSFNYKELFTKKYKFLTIMIWIMFSMCSVVFYGMIFILPQILEQKEYLEKLQMEKLYNHTHNNYNNTIANNSLIIDFNNTVSNMSNINDLNNLNNSIPVHKNHNSHGHNPESGDMSFNNFIQLLISALMQIPSTIVATYLASFGRIKSMAFGFFFSFVFCLLSFNKDWFFISIALAKFFICIPDMVSMLYVCEAYPTKIRALGVGVANSWYRGGGVLTPFVNQILFEVHYMAPYVLFTVGSLVGFLSTISLPFESVGKNIR